MQFLRRVLAIIQSSFKGWLDPSSLQLRLTLEFSALAVLGMSSVALWSGTEMKQILVATHKQNVDYIASLFPTQVELYTDTMPFESGLKMTIAKVSTPNLLIWVSSPKGKTLAQSTSTQTASIQLSTFASLKSKMPSYAEVYQLEGKYLVVCGSPLTVRGKAVGQVILAQDITSNQMRLNAVVRNLVMVSALATGVLMVAIALRIRRALHPLQLVSQVSSAISTDDLGAGQLQLKQAPSEIRGLVQAFNRMLSRLSDAWDQQREFVSNVSHELRTPLTVIHGYLQSLMLRGTNLNPYQREAVATAEAEAERTVHLLQDLLELARADTRHLYFRQEPLILDTLVAEIASMTEKFSNRQIKIISTATDVMVKADRDRLQQILINLVDNAVKYSAPDQPVELILEQQHHHALIHVRDRGIGIPLQYQRRIFERFYRVDEHQTRSREGTGLGLAIVKSLVEGMGGQVSVRSKPGEGSLFTVTLSTWER
jgi:heavy metal sensor kinase